MISLLKKDLLNLQSYLKTIFVFIAFFSIVSFSMDDVGFLSGMLIMVFTMIPIASFTYDKQSKWDIFAQTLPVTRQEMVLSKYLLAILFIVIGFVISFTMTAIISLMKESMIEVEMLILSNGLISAIAMILLSIMLPLVYKFGVEKSRIILITICLIPTVLVMLLSNLGIRLPSNFNWELLSYSAPLIALALMVISSIISYKIFCREDL